MTFSQCLRVCGCVTAAESYRSDKILKRLILTINRDTFYVYILCDTVCFRRFTKIYIYICRTARFPSETDYLMTMA